MNAVLPFLLKYWKLLGIGLLVLAFGIMLAVKNHTIASRDRQIASLTVERDAARRDLTQCHATTTKLEQGIAAQNTAIEAQQRASASRVTSLEQSLLTARRSAQTAQAAAAAILARRPGASPSCLDADALALIRGE